MSCVLVTHTYMRTGESRRIKKIQVEIMRKPGITAKNNDANEP